MPCSTSNLTAIPSPPPQLPPLLSKILNKLGLARPHTFRTNRMFSYSEVVAAMLARPSVPYPRFPCVTPAWENTARRSQGGANILLGSTPSANGHWLRTVLADQQTLDQLPKPIVFINAWNEWAEGNHLEPDLRNGHQYLEMTKETLEASY